MKNLVPPESQGLTEFLFRFAWPSILCSMLVIDRLLQTIFRMIPVLEEAAAYIHTFLWAFLSSRATPAARVLAAEVQ